MPTTSMLSRTREFIENREVHRCPVRIYWIVVYDPQSAPIQDSILRDGISAFDLTFDFVVNLLSCPGYCDTQVRIQINVEAKMSARSIGAIKVEVFVGMERMDAYRFRPRERMRAVCPNRLPIRLHLYADRHKAIDFWRRLKRYCDIRCPPRINMHRHLGRIPVAVA